MNQKNVLNVKFLSIKQVAEILDVSERTVIRRLDAGCFVAIKEGVDIEYCNLAWRNI